jgi:hypothetical protein
VISFKIVRSVCYGLPFKQKSIAYKKYNPLSYSDYPFTAANSLPIFIATNFIVINLPLMAAKRYFLACLLLIISAQTFAQQVQKPRMPEFMDQRFGMFVHFGPVTLRGTEIGWSRNKEVAQADYDSLYKEFNPVLFNADAWVKAAKDAGIKYLVITAKHHDGFCLWPTKLFGL